MEGFWSECPSVNSTLGSYFPLQFMAFRDPPLPPPPPSPLELPITCLGMGIWLFSGTAHYVPISISRDKTSEV